MQKPAYDLRISDCISDVCSSDLVPELGREVAIALYPGVRDLHVAAADGRGRGEHEAQRVGPVRLDQIERVHDVALRLGHLLAVPVAHEAVQIDGAERHLAHEVDAHHHHTGDPEEQDVPARSEENTSELQSLMRTSYAVFCLKQNKKAPQHTSH